MKSQRTRSPEAMVRAIYRTLSRRWGAQHWWPAETPFEVIVGAILTQNTAWTNVERALASLRSAGVLNLEGIRATPLEKLEQLVRSSGYYRQKALRLKNFVAYLDEKHAGSLAKMFSTPTHPLRAELLSLKGIGHETADAILLYAGNHQIFVVDAYTRRILQRHEIVKDYAKYDDIRRLVEQALRQEMPGQIMSKPPLRPPELRIHQPSAMSTAARSSLAQVYNEMHGLFVQIGKLYCHKQEAWCGECPLRSLLPAAENTKV
jgi:endonuclease III related protein